MTLLDDSEVIIEIRPVGNSDTPIPRLIAKINDCWGKKNAKIRQSRPTTKATIDKTTHSVVFRVDKF